jgi:hypothetical protein
MPIRRHSFNFRIFIRVLDRDMIAGAHDSETGGHSELPNFEIEDHFFFRFLFLILFPPHPPLLLGGRTKMNGRREVGGA